MNVTQLNDADLRARAPSIFATEPYEGTSDRFCFIPTIKMVDALRDAGFYPVYAHQSQARNAAKQEYTKHLLRFRSKEEHELVEDAKAKANAKAKATGVHAWINSDESPLFPEVALANAHDGSSHYEFDLALYRLACGNGLIVSAGEFESYRVRHSGNILEDALVASQKIIEQAPQLAGTVARIAGVDLSEQQRRTFGFAALALRYGVDERGNLLTGIKVEDVLKPRRGTDAKSNLWSVFNVVQENMTQGGLAGVGATGRRTLTRAISGVDSTLNINRHLWELAEEFAAAA